MSRRRTGSAEVPVLAKKSVDDDGASIVCACLGGGLAVEKCDVWPKRGHPF
jgi:hypothetical protein